MVESSIYIMIVKYDPLVLCVLVSAYEIAVNECTLSSSRDAANLRIGDQ